MTKYEIIKQEIKEQIKDNILKPNQVIKSENEMCQCYKVRGCKERRKVAGQEAVVFRKKRSRCVSGR